ncbi:glutamate 5-kinase [Bradyrhizobium sp. S3.12.5]|uniref:glutamate 5-kinase n=1 Tax=Bradyrhizobium sp. S3.12.5 TaxID=3156386 RepID=UPI0033940B61
MTEFGAPVNYRETDSGSKRPRQPTLASARRIIVKIGSALIVEQGSGTVREAWLDTLANDIARLRGRGQDVALVSSGAVAIGRYALNLHEKMLSATHRQAAAAVGQAELAKAYRERFARHGLTVAQILLTLDDTTQKRRLANLRETLVKLMNFQTIPVINENDAIAGSAVTFGDNDRLAARTAQLVGGDTLVLLSNVAGLYSADPYESASAALIKEVYEVTPQIELMAGGTRLGYSCGGMKSKLVAARMALASGCKMIIADGRDVHPLSAVDAGKPCTWFYPSTEARLTRKRWIAGALRPTGALMVGNGPVTQLRLGESLWAPQVTSFTGDFVRGDAVVIRDVSGSEVARGISIYSSAELRHVTRQPQSKIVPSSLGCELKPIVHRDDLALAQ